jgi:hypothetical protein
MFIILQWVHNLDLTYREKSVSCFLVGNTMTTHRMVWLLLVFFLPGLTLSGCANFIKPEIGATARQDARINLHGDGAQKGLFTTKDMDVSYTLSQAGNTCNLSGTVDFDRSLTDSFPNIARFNMKMSFLDAAGKVLDTVDITPLYRSFGPVYDGGLTIKRSCVKPPGAAAIAFNYFGEFKNYADERGAGGSKWIISYFPFD